MRMLCAICLAISTTTLRLTHYYLFGTTPGDYFANVEMYKSSTLSLAHWILRKNFSEDFTDGSLLKQFILIS